ncbi:MAG: DUF4363 family protein [Evtepia sp.]
MRHFWISFLILLVLFLSLWQNIQYLDNVVDPMKDQLAQAASFAQEKNWNRATEVTRTVHGRWNDKTAYLHVTLRHAEIDEVNVLFDEAMEYLSFQKPGEYAATNAKLIAQLDLICEMERFSWKNVF